MRCFRTEGRGSVGWPLPAGQPQAVSGFSLTPKQVAGNEKILKLTIDLAEAASPVDLDVTSEPPCANFLTPLHPQRRFQESQVFLISVPASG
jgi:hypothetical protein